MLKLNIGSLIYMAPEIINKKKYNNKVDIWSLGCIIHELCTLNFCFESPSIKELITKIIECKHEKINKNIYGDGLQKLIDSLLNIDYSKRPNIDEIIKIVYFNIGTLIFDKIVELFDSDESYQNYIIERNIQNSLDQVNLIVLSRENKINNIKFYIGGVMVFPLYFALWYFLRPISLIATYISCAFTGKEIGSIVDKIINGNEKLEFINKNSIITEKILNDLINLIENQLDENIIKEKLIIHNKENFDNKIQKIKNKLLEKN